MDKFCTIILDYILRCDLLIKNDTGILCGLSFKQGNTEPTIVFIIYCGQYYLQIFCKSALFDDIPCVESKLLTAAIYAECKEKDSFYKKIPAKYKNNVLKICSLVKVQMPRKKLDADILNKFYYEESRQRKKTARRFIKTTDETKKTDAIDIKTLISEMKDFSEENGFNYRIEKNKKIGATVFYIDNYIEEADYYLWQAIFICSDTKKIHIAARRFFKTFSFDESDLALQTSKELALNAKGKLRRELNKFYKEFNTTQDEREYALKEIKRLLQENCSKTKVEYGLLFDKTVIEFYIEKKGNGQDTARKMYETVLTYKAFYKYQDLLREFIKNPYRLHRWNFWSQERKFDKEKFEERFR